MRIALFSDIHGNIVGLKAVLKHIDHLGGADIYCALGDILAIGPGAEDVIEILHQYETRIIRGNWDELFINPEKYISKLPPQLHESSFRHYEWLARNLSPQSQQLLANLPLSNQIEIDQNYLLYMCHAAPNNTESDTCTLTTNTTTLRKTYGHIPANIIAYGHYHTHHMIQLDSKLLINVVSVGMTYGKPSAWTLLEYTDGRLSIQQFQVAYDEDEYERLMRERGVPIE
jgi:predicted phosphodiesterase